MARRIRKAGRGRRQRGRRRKVATLATVKRLITGKMETKRVGIGLPDFKPGNRYVYACAPFRSIPQGTGAGQRVGDAISNVKLRMSFTWTPLGLDSTSSTKLQTGMPLRVLLVRTTNEITAPTHTGWVMVSGAYDANSDFPIFANTVQTVSSLLVPHPDYKVVKQFWLNSSTPVTSMVSGNTVFKQATVNIPKYVYDPVVGTSQAKRYNYYLLVTSSAGQDNPANSTVGSVQAHYMIEYKDS